MNSKDTLGCLLPQRNLSQHLPPQSALSISPPGVAARGCNTFILQIWNSVGVEKCCCSACPHPVLLRSHCSDLFAGWDRSVLLVPVQGGCEKGSSFTAPAATKNTASDCRQRTENSQNITFGKISCKYMCFIIKFISPRNAQRKEVATMCKQN